MSDEVDIVSPKKSRSHRGSSNNEKPMSPKNTPYKIILGVIVALVIGTIGFYSGISYQKNHTSTATATASSNGSGPGGGFGRFAGNRSIGTVSAISASSITVQPANGGNTKTFSITSSTTITDNGQTVATSDIQTGDTVLVSASSTASTEASRILVNPSFGGFGGGAPGGSSSGGSTNSTTTPNTSLN